MIIWKLKREDAHKRLMTGMRRYSITCHFIIYCLGLVFLKNENGKMLGIIDVYG